jgi:hypothetical protein
MRDGDGDELTLGEVGGGGGHAEWTEEKQATLLATWKML